MIDIHCHLLYGVDDGAQTIEESIAMLCAAQEQGVEAIILTPHFRHGMFSYPNEIILENYEKLKAYAKEIGIGLALGTEYHVDFGIVDAFSGGRCRTLAGSRYILCEYSGDSEYSYLYSTAQELMLHGYVPVIAHAERCECITADIEGAARLRELGAWIQLNADAILGLEGMAAKKFCRRMLKAGYADVIASDSHDLSRRPCRLGKCRQAVVRKYGEEYAGRLFYGNPMEIIEDAVAEATHQVNRRS
jgi:protein-tyrosine phosphatase